MRTYLVEKLINGKGHEIVGLFKTLTDAKKFCIKNSEESINLSILKLSGPYFGEGYHQYRLFFNSVSRKFLKKSL